MTTWPSAREAIAAYYRSRRGPRPARPRYGEPSSGTYLPTDDTLVIVGQVLRGPTEQGCCALEPGSPADHEVERWATGTGERTAMTRRAEDRVRFALREAGALDPIPRFRVERSTDEDGAKRSRVHVVTVDDDADTGHG
jgi:hypothetical protein